MWNSYFQVEFDHDGPDRNSTLDVDGSMQFIYLDGMKIGKKRGVYLSD